MTDNLTWWEKCGCPEEAAKHIEQACRLVGGTVSPTQAFYALTGVGGFISRADALDIAKAMMKPPVVNLN